MVYYSKYWTDGIVNKLLEGTGNALEVGHMTVSTEGQDVDVETLVVDFRIRAYGKV